MYISAFLWLLLLQYFRCNASSAIYKTYSSDITKTYPAAASTVPLLPTAVKTYAAASASTSALTHTHSYKPQIPCKKPRHHQPHYTKFFVPAPRSTRLYGHFYPTPHAIAAQPPAQTTTIYWIAAPASPPPAVLPQLAPVPPVYAGPSSYAAAYYDHHLHASKASTIPAAALIEKTPWTLPYVPPSYELSSEYPWQQAIHNNFAK